MQRHMDLTPEEEKMKDARDALEAVDSMIDNAFQGVLSVPRTTKKQKMLLGLLLEDVITIFRYLEKLGGVSFAGQPGYDKMRAGWEDAIKMAMENYSQDGTGSF